MKNEINRWVTLDTETTGLKVADEHRIIEIGCVEIINRHKTGEIFHHYINPEREIDASAAEVHGITNDILHDKPKFIDIVYDFFDFIKGSKLIIHNAEFDLGFLDYELSKINGEIRRIDDETTDGVADWHYICRGETRLIDDVVTVVDSLKVARNERPGQKNSLDTLCRHYSIDNSKRTLHGALLDAEILADVYLKMTGGQDDLLLTISQIESRDNKVSSYDRQKSGARVKPCKVIKANATELAAHEKYLVNLDTISRGACVWIQ